MRNLAGISVVAVGIILSGLWAFAQNQMELTISADEALKKADAELNAVYAQVMSSLNDAQKALLKPSQVAWIKYRDLCTDSEGAMYEGGSIRPMIELNCAADVTTEKTGRLRGMLPAAVAATKDALPSAGVQQAALQQADEELNQVYKDYMAKGPKPAVKEAQVAWLSYRDLCAKAEAALYDKEVASIVAAKCTTELTLARTARLKGLFMEGYPGDREEGVSPFAGAWYGEAEDRFLAFDLTIRGDQVSGTHACGDNEGISVESPDENDFATTLTGKVTGDRATIQIKVGYERDRTVTGTLTNRNGSLFWELTKNAPDYSLMPQKAKLTRQE